MAMRNPTIKAPLEHTRSSRRGPTVLAAICNRVGTDVNVERYVTFQGAATLSSAGAIQFTCGDGNGHTDTILSGKLTVIAVGSVTP